jgi:hypothetical protein
MAINFMLSIKPYIWSILDHLVYGRLFVAMKDCWENILRSAAPLSRSCGKKKQHLSLKVKGHAPHLPYPLVKSPPLILSPEQHGKRLTGRF